MQFNIHDLYDNTGMVKKDMASNLTGHQRLRPLLPNLQLLNQYLHSNADISIHEEAQAGLYFSFIGTGPIKTIDDIKSVQISYYPKNIHGEISMKKNDQISLLQIHISTAHLASTLGENEELIIQHFSSLLENLGNEHSIIQLPFTDKMANVSAPLLSHNGHSISLAGHVYAVIFNLIEQLQILKHLSKCENCQSKLFQAQNLIEALEHEAFNLKHLAQQVGLNTDALSIGFYFVVGQPIESYWICNRIKFSAVKLRKNPKDKDSIIAQSGFSEIQFETAFIQQFGVSSHQYSQVH